MPPKRLFQFSSPTGTQDGSKSWPVVQLQVLQNDGSRMLMLRVTTLSARDCHSNWRGSIGEREKEREREREHSNIKVSMQIGQEAAENFSTVLGSILCHLTNCKSPQSLSHKFILTYIYQKNLSINSQWFIIPSKLKLKFFVLLGFHYRIAQDSSQKHVEVQQNTLNFLTTSQCKKKYDWCHTWLQWYNWCEMLGVCSVYRCSQPSYCAGVRKHRHSAIKQNVACDGKSIPDSIHW